MLFQVNVDHPQPADTVSVRHARDIRTLGDASPDTLC
jgi:hypothetical protein